MASITTLRERSLPGFRSWFLGIVRHRILVHVRDLRAVIARVTHAVAVTVGLTLGNVQASSAQLAELSGFSQQYISGLEQGRRNPTVVTLYELASVLGVSHVDLVLPASSS